MSDRPPYTPAATGRHRDARSVDWAVGRCRLRKDVRSHRTVLEPPGCRRATAARRIADPLSQIVAITFTDRAAREMRDRIRSACSSRIEKCAESDVAHWLSILRSIDGARISTIHSFCAGFLRRHAVAAGVDPQFRLLETEMGETLVRTVDRPHA